jgi:hypothetical protein
MSGWGRGPCGGGLRRGCGGWFGRGLGYFGRRWTADDEKSALDEEEKILKEELAQVQKAKEDLKK